MPADTAFEYLPDGTNIIGVRSPITRILATPELFTGQPLDGEWTQQIDAETLSFSAGCGGMASMMTPRLAMPRTESVVWSAPVTWSDFPQPDSNIVTYTGEDLRDGTFLQTQTDPEGGIGTAIFVPVSETLFTGTISYDMTAVLADCTADGTFTFAHSDN